MQNLQNCKSCGKLFIKMSRAICPDCFEQEEEAFLKVKQYLDEHPKAPVVTVSEETEVSVKQINKFIRDGRILASQYEGLTVECERCGGEVKEGKYCESCKNQLQKEFESVTKDPKAPKGDSKKESGKIHIRDRLDRRR